MHPIARVDAEDIPARLRASPVKVPIIVSRHLSPSTLLKVIQQHRLVHIGAEADLHALILIMCDSAVHCRQIRRCHTLVAVVSHIVSRINLQKKTVCNFDPKTNSLSQKRKTE